MMKRKGWQLGDGLGGQQRRQRRCRIDSALCGPALPLVADPGTGTGTPEQSVAAARRRTAAGQLENRRSGPEIHRQSPENACARCPAALSSQVLKKNSINSIK